MAQLRSSSVALRISGDNLSPDEITRLLGASPSYSRTKGERLVAPHTGRVRIAKFGSWHLRAVDQEPEDLNGQVHEILGQLTSDLAIWQKIADQYDVDLFCGLFMSSWNDWLNISPQSLSALGARGIEITMDIYGGEDQEDDTDETSAKKDEA